MAIEPPETIPPETIYVTEPVVACDGGGGALGHPRVYLNAGHEGRVECPYCDRLYIVQKIDPAAA